MNDYGASSYRRFLEGDEQALEELIRLYSDELIRYACCFVKNAALAEDVMEDTFATLIVKRKRLKEGSFKAYLFRIARNKCFDALRRAKHECADWERFTSDSNPEKECLKSERDRKLYACLQTLPVLYRDVLHLVYLDGIPLQEVQTVLRKTRKQCYNLLQRAKVSLREKLEKEGICYEDV